jgi:Outer membrane protein beta-barrel domain
MKKTTNLVAAICLAAASLLCTKASAQSSDSKFRFGIGVDGLLPVGSLTNSVNFGLGITPRLQYSVSDKFALTFTSGFYHFFSKQIHLTSPLGVVFTGKYDLDIVPVKAGVKYFVLPNIYLAGEAGVGFEVEDGGGPADLVLSPGIGYASKSWDVGLRYENFHNNTGSIGVFGLRVAYGFKL